MQKRKNEQNALAKNLEQYATAKNEVQHSNANK